jgi:hypothetical protein
MIMNFYLLKFQRFPFAYCRSNGRLE